MRTPKLSWKLNTKPEPAPPILLQKGKHIDSDVFGEVPLMLCGEVYFELLAYRGKSKTNSLLN